MFLKSIPYARVWIHIVCLFEREDAMKDVGMRIRVEPELREQFISLCHEHNVPAAQVLRSFMRDFVQGSSSWSMIWSAVTGLATGESGRVGVRSCT